MVVYNKNPLVDEFIKKQVDKCAAAAVKEEPAPKTELLSEAQRLEKAKIIIQSTSTNQIERINSGFSLLLRELQKAVKEKPAQFPPDLLEEIKKFDIDDEKRKDFLKKLEASTAVDLKEFFGLSDPFMQAVYDVADVLYQHKHYAEAADILYFLSLLDIFAPLPHFAIGHAKYHLHDYQAAMASFMIYSLFVPEDPRPFLYAARCCINLEEKEKAPELIKAALELSTHHPELNEIKNEAIAMQKELIQK